MEEYLADNEFGPRFRAMSPELCRAARKAVSMTQRQLADAIGESLASVYRYEAGRPTDEAVAKKLIAFFNGFPIRFDRSGRIQWVVRKGRSGDGDEQG